MRVRRAAPVAGDGYARRHPEETVLYQAVAERWPLFRERMREAGGLPKFVVREFEEYLKCGINGTLYFSEMKNGNNPPPASRILKIDSSNQVSVFISDSGSNGLVVDSRGNLIAADHGIGGVVSYDLATKMATTLVSQYMNERFNSPNDLTLKRDGTLYFTDPGFQNGARPQGATRAYQVLPGTSTATVIASDYSSNPNGITLSLDEQTLFIDGGMGVREYAIDGSGNVANTGVAFGSNLNMNTDGMVEDCAGNLYVAVASSTNIVVVDRDGKPVANSPIQVNGPSAVTNVAFAGTDHKTLYITGSGLERPAGRLQSQSECAWNAILKSGDLFFSSPAAGAEW